MLLNGIDILSADLSRLRGRNIALLVNQTAVTADGLYLWQLLQQHGVRVVRIFSPEHGLFAVEQDQIAVADEVTVDGIPVISLYGADRESLLPDDALLDDLDLIIYDIQDIGSRYYTYANTLAMLLEQCAGRDLEIMVLDRPNPLGRKIEGPPLEPGFHSFVGVIEVPVRHGLTAGGLALWHAKQRRLAVQLTVLGVQGDTGCQYADAPWPLWVPPSPNMPTPDTALVYPGMCLLEGTNISEGRGTTMPFLLCGAPGVPAADIARELNALGLPGILFREMHFRPGFQKHAGKICSGVFLHLTDRARFLPLLTGLAVIEIFRRLWTGFAFIDSVYEFEHDRPAFDLLCGSDQVRTALQAGTAARDIAAGWAAYNAEFALQRQDVLASLL